MKERLDALYRTISIESLKIIQEKKIDMDDLAFKVGISRESLLTAFEKRNKDFSIYLSLYNYLVEW